MATSDRQIKKGTRMEIGGIGVIVLALLCAVALWREPEGLFGETLLRVIYVLFGSAAVIFPVVLAVCGVAMMFRHDRRLKESKLVGYILLGLSLLSYLHLPVASGDELVSGLYGMGGGVVGGALVWAARTLFGALGLRILLSAAALTGFLLVTEVSLAKGFLSFKKKASQKLKKGKEKVLSFIYSGQEAKKSDRSQGQKTARQKNNEKSLDGKPYPQEGDSAESKPNGQKSILESISPDPSKKQTLKQESIKSEQKTKKESGQPAEEQEPQSYSPENSGDKKPIKYRLPSLSLLQRTSSSKSQGKKRRPKDQSRLLEDTLDSFGVQAEVIDVSHGPVVTRYELHPAAGVKVSRVLNLADDLALSLAATDVRIEAPIPGKAAIGIEVPNEEINMVSLREVLETLPFQETDSKLAVGLGKDIAGSPVVTDLGKMVHLLVAGATGSGKSVCMNTIIGSLLFKAKPDEVKLLMIDPKVVELSNYNGIPHLAAPVVTDPKKAAGVLKWVVQEMENRYSLFAKTGVREISKYNDMIKEKNQEKDSEEEKEAILPFMVVIIDELADLMMVAAVEVEDAICRLAQMARAAGIHLVVATQRPSVDVVTGLIKANIPSRLSFSVSSQVDSRTILDMSGAEKLLGRGDMLFLPSGASKPLRIQGAYIGEKEIDKVVSFWKEQDTPDYNPDIINTDEAMASAAQHHEDTLFPKAVDLILNADQASISLLQRRLHIGYTRAARLIDMMEDRGIVGKHEGSKPREILITPEQWEAQASEEGGGE